MHAHTETINKAVPGLYTRAVSLKVNKVSMIHTRLPPAAYCRLCADALGCIGFVLHNAYVNRADENTYDIRDM